MIRHPYEALTAAETLGWVEIDTCPDIADYEPDTAELPANGTAPGQD